MGLNQLALIGKKSGVPFLFAFFFYAQSSDVLGQGIRIDERFDDWENRTALVQDKKNDGAFASIDFAKIAAANDSLMIYFYLELGRDFNIQSNNNLKLNIDLDNNPLTGLAYNGIGVDLQYNFAAKNGLYHSGGTSTSVNQAIVGLVSSPTVTSSRFEIALKRRMTIGGATVELGNTIQFFVEDAATGGDRAPDSGGATYVLQHKVVPKVEKFSFTKQASNLRILSYNVERDNFFNSSARSSFSRILKSIAPDLFCFQEIYNHTGLETRNLVAEMLGQSADKWFYDEVNPDIRIVSKYPIISKQAIDGNGAFLMDIGQQKLLVLVAHLPCCDSEVNRQKECDNIMAFIRNSKKQQGVIKVDQNTPIVICGDMNLVGLRFQQQTLLTGDIFDENSFGGDFNPDWDETALEDVKPSTTGLSTDFTWKTDGSFSPGRLDYILYTGSQMKLTNSFCLFTPGLTFADLEKNGLNGNDVTVASDHLPIVGDFELNKPVSTPETDLLNLRLSPNPTQHLLNVYFDETLGKPFTLTLHDDKGRLVYHLSDTFTASPYVINLPSSLGNGLYFCTIQSKSKASQAKLMINR